MAKLSESSVCLRRLRVSEFPSRSDFDPVASAKSSVDWAKLSDVHSNPVSNISNVCYPDCMPVVRSLMNAYKSYKESGQEIVMYTLIRGRTGNDPVDYKYRNLQCHWSNQILSSSRDSFRSSEGLIEPVECASRGWRRSGAFAGAQRTLQGDRLLRRLTALRLELLVDVAEGIFLSFHGTPGWLCCAHLASTTRGVAHGRRG
jgi:hypothetical protein